MPPRPAPRDMRASDTDRERVVAMLAEALADGRLTNDEYSQRTEAALTARTLGDLAGLTTDLAAPDRQPLRLDGGQAITAFFGSAERYGRWVVPASVACAAVFGEAVLDLREALLQDRHVVLTVYAFLGRVRLIVPAGVEVVLNGTGILARQRGATAGPALAGRALAGRALAGSDVPVIEVRGYAVASEILVRTPPRPRRWLPRWRRAPLP